MEFNMNTAKQELKNITTQYLQKDAEGNYKVDVWQRLPVFLAGPAGVGKTQVVGEVAKEMEIGFVSYSMVHHTRQSLLGLPAIRTISYEGKELQDTEYTLSEIIGTVYKAKEEGAEEGILFLDEANCCSESIQPVLLSFLQSKTLGNAKLPDGWIIVLCGNPPRSIYNKNARSWDAVLLDRLRVINIKTDHQEYLKYAREHAFHSAVQYYLTLNPKDAYICESKDNNFNLVTYRTWENLSSALYNYEELGLSVTPVMLNEYIKDDDVALKFYEIYRYSQVDSEAYETAAGWVMGKKSRSEVVTGLKRETGTVVYGVMNLVFKKLSGQAEFIMQEQKFLQKFKENILKQNFAIDEYNSEYMPETMRKELKTIWNTVSYEELHGKYVDVFNRYIQEFKDKRQEIVKNAENMLLILEEMKNEVLIRFYLRIILNKVEWLSVMKNTEHKEIDRLANMLKMDKDEDAA